MVFLSICTALYDYAPQGEHELILREGELVFILEKSDEDDWWKAKKKAPSEDEEEPTGLIPNNYVEEVSDGIDLSRQQQYIIGALFQRLFLFLLPEASVLTLWYHPGPANRSG